jgi:hypothetical protein
MLGNCSFFSYCGTARYCCVIFPLLCFIHFHLFHLICYKLWKIGFLYSGKLDCALFGDYVYELNKKMGKAGEGLPVLVIQFANDKIFRGNTILNFDFLLYTV